MSNTQKMPRLSASRILAALLCTTVVVCIFYSYQPSPEYTVTPVPVNDQQVQQQPQASPVVAATIHLPSLTPSQHKIKKFFAHWSASLHHARPHINPLNVVSPAPNVIGQALPPPRQPARSRLRLPPADVASLAASHHSLLSLLQAPQARLPALARVLYTGTGVVMVAGGEYWGPALIGLRMLRRSGCQLPAEIFVGTTAEYEPALCASVLPELGASCVVLPAFLSPPLSPDVTHYQLKSLAILFSSFRRVLYLDSDSIPLLDPTPLFENPPFAASGLVLWPDFWTATEDPVFYYNISGLGHFPPDLPPTSSEAGQMLVDKAGHLDTLLLAAYYNIFGPDWFYPLLSQGALGQGDKETFLAAAVVLGRPWTRVHKAVEVLGSRRAAGRGLGNVSGMVQFHPGDDLAAQNAAAAGGKQDASSTGSGDAPNAAASQKPTHSQPAREPAEPANRQADSQPTDKPPDKRAAKPPDKQPEDPPALRWAGERRDMPESKKKIRPMFIHANTPKMNAGHLVDEGDLVDGGKSVRLWGSRAEAITRFGEDIERVVWREIVYFGCALEKVVWEWRDRERLCERLRAHWRRVFDQG